MFSIAGRNITLDGTISHGDFGNYSIKLFDSTVPRSNMNNEKKTRKTKIPVNGLYRTVSLTSNKQLTMNN